MPNRTNDSFKSGSDEFFAEMLIASAKDYVVPTDQLRSRVLDAVRDIHLEKEGSRWVGRSILVTAILFWTGTLTMPFVNAIQAKHDERRDYVETRTQELFDEEKVEIQSATSQAYSEWRSGLKQRFESND